MINRQRQENRIRRRKARRKRRRERRRNRRNKFAAEGEQISLGFFKKVFNFFKDIFVWIYNKLISPVLNYSFAYTICFFVINILLKLTGFVKEVN